jgi:Glyoxalase/Bleomycin resistance protein/Dioxygenase superfamily
VRDMTKSVEHYCNAFGFAVTFQYGNPIFYACLCRDEVALHLLSAQQTKRLPGNGAVCVFVKDVDSLHAELAARGAKVVKPPKTTIMACATLMSSIPMATSLHSVWDHPAQRIDVRFTPQKRTLIDNFAPCRVAPSAANASAVPRPMQSVAYEIDPALDRHEVDDGPVLHRERLDVSSAVLVRFSERVLCALGREQDARLGKRDPSPLVRWQYR